MTTATAIDIIITDHLDVGDFDVPIAQDDALRGRCLRALQESVNWLCTSYNWTWMASGNATETAVSGNQVIKPSDFAAPGEQMAIFRTADGHELVRKDQQTLARLINEPGAIVNNLPLFWCPFSSVDSASGIDTVCALVYPGCDGDFGGLNLDKYQRTPPTLIDGEEDIYSNPAGSSLNQVPASMHLNVVIPYAVRKLMRMEGDAREDQVWSDVIENLARFWRQDVNQNTPVRNTRYGRSGRFR